MRKIISFAWVIVMFAGCSTPATATSPSASHTPTLQSARASTATITPQPTSTATPGPRFTRQCLPIDDREVELKEVASGTIFLFHFEPDAPPAERDVFNVKDIQTGSEYKLPVGPAYFTIPFLDISPNRKMIAQMERDINDKDITIRNVLWVFDTQAKVLSKIIFDRTDLGQPRWLDDERLLIDTEEYGRLLLVNPFTGEQRVIVNQLPDRYPYFPTGGWWPAVYSPDLEWAAYFSARKENGDYKEGPVVYDLATKQILWAAAGNGVGSDPVWSADGQVVAFTGGMDDYQLYLISRSGQAKAVPGENLPHKAFAFSWSPDGHYIAFWNADSLMIYDRQTDWVFDTCILSNDVTVLPNWSPDSQQMIVYVNDYSTPLILIDWPKQIAYKIKDIPNRVIHGWMNSLP